MQRAAQCVQGFGGCVRIVIEQGGDAAVFFQARV
jgi:hypothetical protein